MIVLTLPPTNEPIIFTSTDLGYIVCLKPNVATIAFGAHNDGLSSKQ
jgi:hypothetical protein